MPTYTKKFSNMSLDELKERANIEGYNWHLQQMRNNPGNSVIEAEFFEYCRQHSMHPDPEVIRAREIPLEQLRAELVDETRRVEATEKDSWQSLNAERWIASQPQYIVNPENGKKLANEVERRGYRGSVMEIQECFEYLVNRGEIIPRPLPPAPVRIYSEAELRSMPMDELKRVTEEAARNGVL